MKAFRFVIAVLLFSNVLAVAGQLCATNASWMSYVNLFGVVLFGYYLCRLVYWDDV